MARQGFIAISYITLYGDLNSDYTVEGAVGVLNYCPSETPIEISGYETIVTPGPAKILYKKASVTIIGEKTIVTPDVAILNLLSNPLGVGEVKIVTSTPCVMRFYSDNITTLGYERIINLSPAKYQYLSNGIEVFGYKKVIFISPAKILFSSGLSSGTISIGFYEVQIVESLPATIEYSSNIDIKIYGYKTTITPPFGKISFLGESNLYTTTEGITLISKIPFFSLFTESSQPSFLLKENLNIELPSLTLNSQILYGKIGEYKAYFPKLKIFFESGVSLTGILPFFQGLEVAASTNYLANIKGFLPKLRISMIGKDVGVNSELITFPKLSLTLNIITGETAVLTTKFPHLKANTNIITGGLIKLTGTLPVMTSRIFGEETGDNDINLEFNIFKMLIDSINNPSIILRYIQGQRR